MKRLRDVGEVPQPDMRAALGDCDHKPIADAPCAASQFLIPINALPTHSAMQSDG
jgi:hypothetical protein